jgi:hypothetical protein
MKAEDFVFRLSERWPGINKAVLGDITDELMKYSESSVSAIYDIFIRSYSLVSPPAFGAVCKAINQSGQKKIVYGPGKRFVWRCSCGIYWDKRYGSCDGYRCPKCRKLHDNSKAVEYQKGIKIVWVQDNCISPDGTKACEGFGSTNGFGPTCDQYGKPGGEECRTCGCRTCCLEYGREKIKIRAEEEEFTNG